MKKRILALMASAAMVFTAGCAEAPQLMDFIDPNAGDVKLNLDGQEFWFSTGWEDNYHIPEDYKSVPSEILELKHDKWFVAEKEFNMVVQIDKNDPFTRISAGYGAHELIDNDLDHLYDFYKSGILTPLEEVPTIDLNDEKWGDKDFIKYGNFNGKQYGFYPWNWMSPEVQGAMMFNGKLVKSLGGTVPYEYQESGTWNWETFENELKKYPETVGETTLTPLNAQEYQILGFAALHSNGLSTIVGDEESGYEFGFNNANAYAALDWLNGLYESGLSGTGSMDSFTKYESCVYYIGESYFGTANNPDSGEAYAPLVMEDYGFITFPTGPNGTENDTGAYTFGVRRLLTVSSLANLELSEIGTVLNFVFDPLEGYEGATWAYELKNLVLQSEESYNNWLKMIENADYNYSTQLEKTIESINSALRNAITGGKTPAMALSEITPNVNDNAAQMTMGE